MSQNRKRVLFLCSWYPNDYNPTLGNFVQKHAESVQINNDVATLSIFSSVLDKKIRIVQSTSKNVKQIIVYYPKKKAKFFSLFFNFFSHLKAFKLGFKIAHKTLGKIDIVHLNVIYPMGIWALWLKMKQRIPFVVTEHSTNYHLSTNKQNKLNLFLSKIVLKNASFILPVSDDLGNKLKKIAHNVPIEVISNVVDDSIFTISETTIKNDLKKFIHISTANDLQKNISGIIRVLFELRKSRNDFHLSFVSDGEFDYVISMVNKLNLNRFVSFYSTKTTEEIAQMIKGSDALILFSNYENFPCVIAEAMMCGIPVISTNVNGIPEHVNSKNGILVMKGDEIALLKEIKNFLDNVYEFDKNSIRSYAIKNFSYKAVSIKFDAIYDYVLKKDIRNNNIDKNKLFN